MVAAVTWAMVRRCDGSSTGLVTVITGWLESSQTRGSSSSVVTIVPVSARGATELAPAAAPLTSRHSAEAWYPRPHQPAASSCHPTQSLVKPVFCGVPWHGVTTDYVPVLWPWCPTPDGSEQRLGPGQCHHQCPHLAPPLIRVGTWTINTRKAAAMAFYEN